MITQILNLRHPATDLSDPETVRIDRASPWGNPFRIGPDGDRDTVIAKYETYLVESQQQGKEPFTDQKLAAIHGKKLACWCTPQRCHGEVLARHAALAHQRIHQETKVLAQAFQL